ncbi:MAG: PCMD domain-containing protein [Bacteroidetes bacterium]|nr:PCMD domain-containing protein [Bacteroidota bacterium]
MKKINLSIILLLLIFVGCSKNDEIYEKGTLSFGAVTFVDDVVNKDYKTKDSEMIFAVSVVDALGEEVFKNSDVSNVDKIPLKSGEYTVRAWRENSLEAAFDNKIYYGEQEITIKDSETTTANVECGLNCILLDISYTNKFKELFTDYQVIVSNDRGELTYDENETRVGYFTPTNILKYSINLKNKLGKTFIIKKSISDIKTKDHIHLTIDVVNKTIVNENDFCFDLIINQTINDNVTSICTELTTTEDELPEVTLTKFDIDEVLIFNEKVCTDFIAKVEALGGLRKIYINFISGFDNSYPKNIDLFSLSSEELSKYGILQSTEKDKINSYITFTSLIRKLPADISGVRHYVLSIGVYDDAFSYITQKIKIDIITASLFTKPAVVAPSIDWSFGVGCSDVVLNGMWATLERPASLFFNYREKGKTDWEVVPYSNKYIYNEEDKTFSTSLKLNLDKTYEFRVVDGENSGETLEFSTLRGQRIPNMNFDDWYKSGKEWFPVRQGSSPFWDTGNAGVNYSMAGGYDSNTSPETVKVVKGKAAKLSSIYVSVVKFAAGNIFTGYFDLSIMNPMSSVHFGQPFSERPRKLVGYYMYNPKKIESGSVHQGEMDNCHIYVSLECWGGATERPGGSVSVDPSDPKVVGYGELVSSENSSEYKYFEINIAYNWDKMPDHIIIVASSSKWGGDDYSGGLGSTLYLDEFDFVY